MIFVTWKWSQPKSPRFFTSEHVNVLRSMIARHYQHPHRLVCFTDEPDGLDPRIEALPCPVHFNDLASPHGERFPSSYRRLWVFSPECAALLGPRIFCTDIDVIIVSDIAPLMDVDGDFVGWAEPRFGWKKVAGGVYMLRTGTHTDVWTDFDPATSPAAAIAAGKKGSDQGWMSLKLYPPDGVWTSADHGLVKAGWIRNKKYIPNHVRIISTGGHCAPWLPAEQQRYPWIKEHWR